MTISYVLDGVLYLNITNRCPNRCEFCVRDNTDALGDADSLWLEREPTMEEILQDLQKRDLSAYPQLVFCGFGEPLSRLDDLLTICDWIRARSDIRIRVNTNGLSDLMYGFDTVQKLKGRVDSLSISLNSATPEGYDAICHSDYGLQAHGAMLQFAAKAAKIIDSVTLSVVDTISAEEIEACRKLAEKAGTKFRVRAYIE